MPPKGRPRARKRHVGYIGFFDYQPHVQREAEAVLAELDRLCYHTAA